MKVWIISIALALAVLGGGFYWLAPYNIAASVPHLPGVGPVLHQYLRNAVDRRADKIEIPRHVDLDDPALIRLGAGHFATGCATCHGAPGTPRNPVVLGMQPEPPRLSSDDYTAREFWWLARHGAKYTGMPAWAGEDRDDEPWAMAAFLTHYDDFDRAAYEEAAHGEADGSTGQAIRFGGLPGVIAPENACGRCHGDDGLGRDGTAPKLAGQNEGWLALVLEAYALDHRQSGFMEPLAAPLSPETRAGIAREFAEKTGAWTGRPLSFGDAERGRMLATQGDEHEDIASCASCHEGAGADGLSPKRADTPRIAGQDGYWLVNWLQMYRDGPVPRTPRAHLMQAAARHLTDEDIADLAAYYARAAAE